MPAQTEARAIPNIGGDAGKRAVSPSDVVEVKAVGRPVINDAGTLVAYTVRDWPETAISRAPRTQLHIARVLTTGEQQSTIVSLPAAPSAPAWSSPSGSISILMRYGTGAPNTRHSQQIWNLHLANGELQVLTDEPTGVYGFAWSTDYRFVAYAVREPIAVTVGGASDAVSFDDDAGVVATVVVMEIETGNTRRLRAPTGYHAITSLSWSPDGQLAAVVQSATPDRNHGVWMVTANTSEGVLIAEGLPELGPLAWCDDSRTLAVIGAPPNHVRDAAGVVLTNVKDHFGLIVVDTQLGIVHRVPNEAHHVMPGRVLWIPGTRRVLLVAGRGVFAEVLDCDPLSGAFAVVSNGLVAQLSSISHNGMVAMTLTSDAWPMDVFVADAAFATITRVADTNPDVRTLALGTTRTVSWRSDGFDIEGILLTPPPPYSPPYPLLVVVHGGPMDVHFNVYRGASKDAGQYWAGQGWAVLYPNPRGSTNYGKDFMSAIVNDWGGADLRDILNGVDDLAGRGVIDPTRAAISGWSYGGFMAAWAVTQTKRFYAAIVGAGISNLLSMYGTTNLPGAVAAYLSGAPSCSTMSEYVNRSPITHVDNVDAKVLILHGEKDTRTPLGQAFEFHRALSDQGKRVNLVVYPREGHGFSEYGHQVDRIERSYAWVTATDS